MLKAYNYGADGRIRTACLLITNQLLYQLSYAGKMGFNTVFDTEKQGKIFYMRS